MTTGGEVAGQTGSFAPARLKNSIVPRRITLCNDAVRPIKKPAIRPVVIQTMRRCRQRIP